jgi:hypothetical protein
MENEEGGHYRDLRCELSDDEVAERADLLAQFEAEREKTERDKGTASATFRAELKRLAEEITVRAGQVRDHAEQRSVLCIEKIDRPSNLAELVRTDTGEVIRRRSLSETETQGELLPIDGGGS